MADAPDPEPARRLRRLLAEQRRGGVDFGTAWPASLTVALEPLNRTERRTWGSVLADAVDIWRCGYERSGARLQLSILDPRGGAGERY